MVRNQAFHFSKYHGQILTLVQLIEGLLCLGLDAFFGLFSPHPPSSPVRIPLGRFVS